MLYRKKASLLSKYKIPLIFLGIVALLIGAFFAVRAITLPEEEPGEDETKYEQLPGEGENNRLYPNLAFDEITRIAVDNPNLSRGSYTMLRSESDGNFYLFYKDENGEDTVYYPDIAGMDSSFDYSSLYATEALGEGSVARIYYLADAVGNIRFSERIALSENEEAKAEQLSTYGFTDQSPTVKVWASSTVENEDGTTQTVTVSHTVTVGATVVTGVGHYLMVDDRAYIYAGATETMNYALQEYPYYINTRLISEPTPDNYASFSPYFTPSYKQWKNTLYETVGDTVTDTARVIVNASVLTPLSPYAESVTGAEDGYIHGNKSNYSFNLDNLKSKSDYARLIAALAGKAVGTYEESPIVITLVADGRTLDFSESETIACQYRITAIEAVLLSDGERTSGTVGTDAEQIKVTYDFYLSGEKQNKTPLHGVLSLSDEVISASLRSLLCSATLAKTLSEPICIDIDYTKENTKTSKLSVHLFDVISIYDQNGQKQSTVGEDSIVSYRYYYMVDGERSATETTTVDFSAQMTGVDAVIREKMLGLSAETLVEPLLLYEQTQYSERMYDFLTYEIDEICYFIERELKVSFSYVNASERDPFYAESFYANELSGKYGIYGMNSGTCETVIEILGGIGTSGTTAAEGYLGLETVAVGITPQTLYEFGLYAHTIYYEMPRWIIPLETEDENTEDYDWYSTIGFTLYISEPQADGTRYIASDLYDNIVRVSGEDFVFLDYDFVEFWTRRQMVIVDISLIEEVKVSFCMDDLKGDYRFSITHNEVTTSSGSSYNQMIIRLSPSGEYTSETLRDYLESVGGSSVLLDTYYDAVLGGGEEVTHGKDYAGAGYFKEVMQLIYYTSYMGMVDLSEDEREAITEASDPLLRFSVKLESSGLPYVFEFYRLDDRRVMVRHYQADSQGNVFGSPVSDFYVSTYAWKKISSAFLSLIEAKPVDPGDGYGDS